MRTFIIESTMATYPADYTGLPSPQLVPLLQGTEYVKHTGRFLDAVSDGAYLMLRHGREYAPCASRAQFLSHNSNLLMQTLTVSHNGEPVLSLQQILLGWPLTGNLWFENIGRPSFAPLQRIPKCPRTDDVNGKYTPLPVRIFVRHKKCRTSNNKLRLWRVSADGLPPSYCVFWPDGDCRFIHVARLVQHYLAADPEHWQDYL